MSRETKEMRFGIVVSLSFILGVLLLILISRDNGARNLPTTSRRDIQLKEVLYSLKQLATNGHLPTNIVQAEDPADVEMHNKHVNEDDDKRKHVHDYHETSHMDHIKPELNVFFVPSDLKVGKVMPIYFSPKDPSVSPKFLPKEEADQIPFSSKQLPSLLKYFNFSKHSPQAKAMKYTLDQCEFEPMEGETKFCATSLESLLDFSHDVLGSESQFKAVTTTHLTNSTNVLLQNYTILQIKEISAPKVIGCHPMPYPYAIFYCHCQESDTNLFEVLVEGENGGRVQAAAVCHMDTSNWNRDHVSFSVLKVEPGTSPVCHFFPPDNLVWVPLPASLK